MNNKKTRIVFFTLVILMLVSSVVVFWDFILDEHKHKSVNNLIGYAEIKLIFMGRFSDYSNDDLLYHSYSSHMINNDDKNFEKVKNAVTAIEFDEIKKTDIYYLTSTPLVIYIVFNDDSYIKIYDPINILIYSADGTLSKKIYAEDMSMTGREQAIDMLKKYGDYQTYDMLTDNPPVDASGRYKAVC